MVFKKIISIITISFLLLFAGCGEEVKDCSSMNTQYKYYSFDEETQSCILSNEIEKDVCGNDVKEDDETYCNCPEDVADKTLSIEDGGCSGNKGDYLEYSCSEETNTCELEVTDKVKQNSKLLTLKEGSEVEFDVKINYYTPFMLDRHNIEVEILLKNFRNDEDGIVENIMLRKAYIVNSDDELLGEIDINKELEKQYDTMNLEIPLNTFTFDTFDIEKKNNYIKLLLSYDKKRLDKGEVTKSESITTELKENFERKLHIIDPEKKNEDLGTSGSSGWG